MSKYFLNKRIVFKILIRVPKSNFQPPSASQTGNTSVTSLNSYTVISGWKRNQLRLEKNYFLRKLSKEVSWREKSLAINLNSHERYSSICAKLIRLLKQEPNFVWIEGVKTHLRKMTNGRNKRSDKLRCMTYTEEGQGHTEELNRTQQLTVFMHLDYAFGMFLGFWTFEHFVFKIFTEHLLCFKHFIRH